jgi:3-oxoacyl-[acyl-carrier-protein] synthase III
MPHSTTTGTITGWGIALPERVVSNDDIAAALGTTNEWIVERTGIHRRHVGGTTSSLSIEAARAAITRAAIDPRSIDTLIVATTTPDQKMPATASAVQHGLGIRCGAMDLNAACSGFVYGLIAAYGLVGLGARRILLIGADVMSRITDQNDRSTAILFGDGAGAVILEAMTGPAQLLGWDLDSDGSALSALHAPLDGHIEMHGKEVFRRAVRIMCDSAERAMKAAGVTVDDVTLMIPHQANKRIVETACDNLGIDNDRAATIMQETGNTASASIPMALVHALESGQICHGDILLLVGFGAGMTAASAVLRWHTRNEPPSPMCPGPK